MAPEEFKSVRQDEPHFWVLNDLAGANLKPLSIILEIPGELRGY